jgi:hypothetical protein
MLQLWFKMVGIQLDGQAILNLIKDQISVGGLVSAILTVIAQGVGNALLVLLLVLYLLAEQSQHAPGRQVPSEHMFQI